jgi:hypothetical protein
MTTITWANFPEIKPQPRGQEMALIACEMFLPQSYATNKEKFRQVAQKIGKIAYLTVGITGAIMLATDIEVLASASVSEMEGKAQGAYKQLVWIAKWAICIKGGWSTINKMLQEDFEGAKKSSIQYLIIFIIVMAFPKALNYIEGFFE